MDNEVDAESEQAAIPRRDMPVSRGNERASREEEKFLGDRQRKSRGGEFAEGVEYALCCGKPLDELRLVLSQPGGQHNNLFKLMEHENKGEEIDYSLVHL